MAKNSNLAAAKKAKNDEFYTAATQTTPANTLTMTTTMPLTWIRSVIYRRIMRV